MIKKIFLLTLFLIFIGFLAWVYLSGNELESSLKGVTVDVFLDNNKYEIRSGKLTTESQDKEEVLRLAAFYAITHEDPLFTFPEFDVDEFEKSINDLILSEDDLLSILGIEGKTLFPHSFIESMINASLKNQEFLENPSYENAVELINLQYKAASDYADETEHVLKVLRENPGPATILIGIRADNKTAISDFNKLIENSSKLSDEIKRREDCLNGEGECYRGILDLERPEGFGRKLSSEIDLIGKELIYYPSEGNNVRGPYISNTPCYGWGDNYSYKPYPFYLKEGTDNAGETYSDIQLATDMFFRKIPEVSSFTTDQVLRQRGIDYIKIDSTTLYLCYYHGYLAEILTMDSFLAEKSPFLDPSKFEESERDYVSEVVKMESGFFTSETPSYENAKLLAEYYFYLYRMMLDEKNPDEKYKNELLNRYLYLDRKLVNINEIVRYGKLLIDGLISIEKASERIDPLASERLMFPGRTFYGLLYFPFSKSVYRLEDDMDYFQKIHVRGVVGQGKPFINYNEAIKQYDIDTIHTWISSRDEVTDVLLQDLGE